MKCPNCTHNQLRGKNGMTCTKCGYQFVFDPRSANNYKLTDGKFLGILKRASRGDTYYFTEDELYYVAAMKTNVTGWGCFLFGLPVAIFMGFWCSGFFQLKPMWIWTTGIAVLLYTLVILSTKRSNQKLIPRKKWDKGVARWEQRFGNIPRLIKEPGLHNPPPDQVEPDIHSYGASQIIICQHDIQVDWLILNNFHTANSAIIISEAGYPEYLSKDLDELIQRNPQLKIGLIHDAGSVGEAMVERIRNNWPFDSNQITDMGINNEMVNRFGVHREIRKSFGDRFPLHAVPFAALSTMLSSSIVHETSLIISWETIHGDDGDLDGAADGDGDGE